MAPPDASPQKGGEPALPERLALGLEDFLEALRVEAGLSRNTLRAYRGDLERFLRWCARRGVASSDFSLRPAVSKALSIMRDIVVPTVSAFVTS